MNQNWKKKLIDINNRFKLLNSDYSNFYDVYMNSCLYRNYRNKVQINNRICNFPEFKESVLWQDIWEKTFFDDQLNLEYRIYCIRNHIISKPICQCGKDIDYSPNLHQYKKGCSASCIYHLDEVKAKLKQTTYDKYGVDNVSQCENIKQKKRTTCLKNHGVESPWQSDIIREKAKKTSWALYGSEYPCQSKKIKAKMKKTILATYGVTHQMCSNEVKAKIRETYLKNNLDSIWNNILSNTHCRPLFDKEEYIGGSYDILYNWQCTNCNLIYESYYYSGRVKVCSACTKSRSLGEIELYNYIQSLIPDIEVISNDYSVIPPKEIDIYIPSMKLAFEYNGDYWHSLKSDGYHEEKTDGCLFKEITLYHIWENEWKKNKNIIQDMIYNIINKLIS